MFSQHQSSGRLVFQRHAFGRFISMGQNAYFETTNRDTCVSLALACVRLFHSVLPLTWKFAFLCFEFHFFSTFVIGMSQIQARALWQEMDLESLNTHSMRHPFLGFILVGIALFVCFFCQRGTPRGKPRGKPRHIHINTLGILSAAKPSVEGLASWQE